MQRDGRRIKSDQKISLEVSAQLHSHLHAKKPQSTKIDPNELNRFHSI